MRTSPHWQTRGSVTRAPGTPKRASASKADRREPPAAVGHNPLAGLTYLLLYAMFGAQIVTGLAIDALAEHQGRLWGPSGWVLTLAPIPVIRLAHHLVSGSPSGSWSTTGTRRCATPTWPGSG